MSSRYIPALDGLRAVAVIAVVLYHMAPAVLPSGMLGVTLFFVLSGYLITGLLVREWRTEHQIRLGRFWVHRVRRLLPAIVLCIAVTAVLTGLFAPELLTKLRRDVLAALFWFSNWWYIFQDLSYFQAAGAPSPVTHFWSLAIEEQFYLVWPPVLLALFKLDVKRGIIKWAVLGLAVASALWMAALYAPDIEPTRVYYGTDTRAFSLLFGVWLAFAFPIKRLQGKEKHPISRVEQRVIGWLGAAALVGIVLCMALVDTYSSLAYYGGMAAISVLTCVLIMGLVVPGSLVARVLSVRPLVWVGRVSYGIYLWHFPLLLLLNPANNTAPTGPLTYALQFVLVVAVASLSYVLVEEPIRQGRLGDMWHALRRHTVTWAQVLARHAVQLVCGAALVVGACVALVVVPDTAAQRFGGEEVPLQVIVPEGAFAGAAGVGAGATGGDGVAGAGTGDAGDALRQELLAQLGRCPSLPALSNETLAQLVATPGQTPQSKARNTQFLMIGDSVSAAFSEKFYGGFAGLFPNAILDANYNRQLLAGIPILENYLNEGWNGPVVVVELSTNGPVSVADLDRFIDAVPAGKMIFIANTRGVPQLEDSNNKHIYTAAANHPNVQVLDWFANSMNRDQYFDGDGTHLTPQAGRDAYLNMVLSALETLY